MKQINLLPKSEQKEIALEQLFSGLLKFWVWIILSLLVFALLVFGARFYLDHTIAQADAQVAENQSVLNSSDYKVLQGQITNFNSSITEITSLKNQHYDWSNALTALANLTSGKIQLNHIVLNRDTGEIDIAGQAETRDDVIGLWSDIIKSDYFKNINFPLANLEKAEVANFNFTFFVNFDKLKDQ